MPCVHLFGSVSKACAPKSLALLEHSLHVEDCNPVRHACHVPRATFVVVYSDIVIGRR